MTRAFVAPDAERRRARPKSAHTIASTGNARVGVRSIRYAPRGPQCGTHPILLQALAPMQLCHFAACHAPREPAPVIILDGNARDGREPEACAAPGRRQRS